MKVKEYREAKKLTQKEIAKLLGMSEKAYSKKELGQRAFKPHELIKLEKILEASISELYADLIE